GRAPSGAVHEAQPAARRALRPRRPGPSPEGASAADPRVPADRRLQDVERLLRGRRRRGPVGDPARAAAQARRRARLGLVVDDHRRRAEGQRRRHGLCDLRPVPPRAVASHRAPRRRAGHRGGRLHRARGARRALRRHDPHGQDRRRRQPDRARPHAAARARGDRALPRRPAAVGDPQELAGPRLVLVRAVPPPGVPVGQRGLGGHLRHPRPHADRAGARQAGRPQLARRELPERLLVAPVL
ncbi:MAG: hypothetical protein AVDCRST_MAG85-103, partial [uncultured Solirubrobacteraceae bacterium]